MPRPVVKPTNASAIKITPAQAGCAANVVQNQPPATVPPMMAMNVPNSKTPLPHDNFFSGNSSGSSPYLDGPKIALWTPIRNTQKIVR